MKNLFTILLLIFFVSNINAQDSKFYLGVGAGYASAGGSAAEDELKGGIYLKLIDMGLRFNENWGVTVGLSSSGHENEGFDDLVVGVASFAVGPMYTTSIGNIQWDIKPQIAFSYKGVYTGDTAEILGLDDTDLSGSAFIIGNSFVFGDGGKGFAFSIDLDYRMGTIKKIGSVDIDLDDDKINNLMLGAGVRYNF